MGNYVGNDAQNTFTLAASGISDVAWSNDEKTIYAATTDGKIKVFDVATHALLNTWSVGKSLGAISLSDDGKTLVAGGVTAADASAVFAIDTSAGTKTTFIPEQTTVHDVEIVDNRHVLITRDGGAAGMFRLDLTTGQFDTIPDSVGVSYNGVLTEDSHLTLIGDSSNIGSGVLGIYDDRTGTIVASGNNLQNNVFDGSNFGVQAISEATGRIYQFNYSGGVNVFDLNIKGLKYLSIGQDAQGFALDDTGTYLYAYQSDGIRQFRLADLAVVATFQAPAFTYPTGGFGNALHVGHNGFAMSVLTQSDRYIFSDWKGDALTLIDLTSRNEVFKGTTGADTFAGGLGDDTYTVNNAGDVVKENKGAGTDTVRSTISTYTLAANVENLVLVGSDAFDGNGNALDNTITGNAQHVNSLFGGAGNDTIIGVGGGDFLGGGLGNDTLISGKGIDELTGGAGNDTYIINEVGDMIVEDPGGGIDTVLVAFSYSLADSVENVENLALTGMAANGTGNRLDNTITGNLVANTLDGGDGNDKLYGMAGLDTLRGGAGNDLLDGGTGRDTLTGGAGNDTYVVDHARDVIVEVAGEGTDTVIASVNWTLGAELENLTLAAGTAPLNGTGNDAANVLTGNDGNNRLDGGLGADKLIGGLGDDTYVVDNKGDKVIDGGGVDDGFQRDTLIGGAGNDTYIVDQSYFFGFDIVEKAGEGTDRVVSSTSYDALPDNVENMVLIGTNNISGGGNALANLITGNAGDNILYGYDGNDTLLGGDGKDTLDGGAGDDTMKGGLGNDFYVVDSTADQVIEKAGEGTRDTVGSFITLTMPNEVESIVLKGVANIDAFGSARNDLLIGNSGVNTLDGKDGNDYLADNGCNDTLTGGAGADYFAIGSFGFVTGNTSFTTITDFSHTDLDVISLADIDANPATQAHDPLTFVGTAAFSGAGGELRYEQKGSDTLVTGDIDGDKVADFTIQLTGLVTLTQSDFELTL